MKFEVFSCSKFRDGAHPGDDAILTIPGKLAAVLDGATDPMGGQKNNQSPGQFAAYSVASSCANLFLDAANMTLPAKTILTRFSDQLAKDVSNKGFLGTPSTTLALALFQPDTIRIITIGDSGVRVNGDKIYRHCKLIDDVSASARVAVFSKLSTRITDLDQLEYTTRGVAFLGMHEAVEKQVLSLDETREIITLVQKKFATYALHEDIEDFLQNGIKSQNQFANLPDHPLGFSTLNGTPPSLTDISDVTFSTKDIQTLELFTDGYASLPTGLSIKDWETTHAEVEKIDFHKTGSFSCVKGSTSKEYFDDRSIISIRL